MNVTINVNDDFTRCDTGRQYFALLTHSGNLSFGACASLVQTWRACRIQDSETKEREDIVENTLELLGLARSVV